MEMREKMKIAGVICELNPLTLGHEYLFRRAKEDHDGLVCVLSGNFVQRGEPAILDKWVRTEMALSAGADLVLELPVPWACAGAERFAAGGVALLDSLGCVDTLLFGSETGDAAPLMEVARVLLSPGFEQTLRELPETGETFAVRRQRAVSRLAGEETGNLLEQPNDILGIEYCKAVLRQGSALEPLAIRRVGAGHDQEDGDEFPSGSQVREKLRAGEALTGLVPEATVRAWEEADRTWHGPLDMKRIEMAVLARLRTMTAEDFARLPEISEGLEHRLYEAAGKAGSLGSFYGLAKTKRYSLARIRRAAMGAFLGLTGDLPALPPYGRILGMSGTGERILRQAAPRLPLVGRPAEMERLGEAARAVFALEQRADDLAGLAAPIPWERGRTCTEKVRKAP